MRRFACTALRRCKQYAAASVESATATGQPVAALSEAQARQFSAVGSTGSHVNPPPEQQQQQQTAAAALPPRRQQQQALAAGAAAAAGGDAASMPDLSWKPPYRLRSEVQRNLDEQVVDFAERLFAADLDGGGQAGGQAVVGAPVADSPGVPSPAGSSPPLKAAAGEAAAESSQSILAGPETAASFAKEAADAYAEGSRARRRRALARAEQRARKQLPLDFWLRAYSNQVAAFQELGERRALGPALVHRILTYVHATRNEDLLRGPSAWEEICAAAAVAAEPAGDQVAAAQQQERQAVEQGEQQQQQQELPGSPAAPVAAAAPATAAPGTIAASQPASAPPPPVLPRLPHVEAAIDKLQRQLEGLGLWGANPLRRALGRCPSLLVKPPTEEALEVLAALLGSRQAVGEAAMRNPAILQMSPALVRQRLRAVALHAHCQDSAAADMVARNPRLLTAQPKLIADNERFLGSLLPMRPYATLVARFPALLTAPLRRSMASLEQAAPPRLARVGLQLLASQQPTILLSRPHELLQSWRQLEALCEREPTWAAELESLTQPTLTWQELEQQEQERQAMQQLSADAEAAAAAKEAAAAEDQKAERDGDEVDSWFDDVYRSAGDSSTTADDSSGTAGEPSSSSSTQPAAASKAPRGSAAEQQHPSWFHRDEKGDAAAAQPGAYGTLRRPWQERDRLRARALARLLDARRWQLQRLEFLLEEAPEQADSRDLLGVVMCRKADFEQRHPTFPSWLAARHAAEREAAREAAAAAEEITPTVAAAGAAAGGGPETAGTLPGEAPPAAAQAV